MRARRISTRAARTICRAESSQQCQRTEKSVQLFPDEGILVNAGPNLLCHDARRRQKVSPLV